MPDPAFQLRVPVPLPENAYPPVVAEIVKLVLLVLAAIMQPDVDAVQAPQVMVATEIVPANVVMVQVVPPTQVAPSRMTSSPATGADAPVDPPDDVDHMAVDELSHVQVVVQTA